MKISQKKNISENINHNQNNHKLLSSKFNPTLLSKEILYYINEARTNPSDFSRHLMYSDSIEPEIQQLSIFFKFYPKKNLALIADQNLEQCAKNLINEFTFIDNGSSMPSLIKSEKEKNSLKVRLKKLGLEPTYYKELIVMGTIIPIKAVSNLFLKTKYREILLSPKINYIGIAAGILPSERFIIVVDLVESLILEDNEDKNIKSNTININTGLINNNISDNRSPEKRKIINFVGGHVNINDFSDTTDSIYFNNNSNNTNDNIENFDSNNFTNSSNSRNSPIHNKRSVNRHYNNKNYNYNNNTDFRDTNFSSNANKTADYWYSCERETDSHIKHYAPKKETIFNVNNEKKIKGMERFPIMKNYYINETSSSTRSSGLSSKSSYFNKFNYNNSCIDINDNKYKYYPKTFNKKSLTPIFERIKKKRRIKEKPKLDFTTPINVSIERSIKINENGQKIPVYSKQTLFEDGSLLIQPL